MYIRLKDALQAANITSPSNDLDEFFKIIVRMGKENPMDENLGYTSDRLFEIDKDRQKTSKINYWKHQAIRINKLFEELGLTNITNIMKDVSYFFIWNMSKIMNCYIP